jgi:hypothetical protein
MRELAVANTLAIALWWCTPVGGLTELQLNVRSSLAVLDLLQISSRLIVAWRSKQLSFAVVQTLVTGTAFWSCVFVVFGAPLISLAAMASTGLFAVLMTCVTVWPASLVARHSTNSWPAVFVRAVDSRVLLPVVIPAWFAVVGAWVGAMVIPLDW